MGKITPLRFVTMSNINPRPITGAGVPSFVCQEPVCQEPVPPAPSRTSSSGIARSIRSLILLHTALGWL